MKKQYTENEIEALFMSLGFDVTDDDKCIDSVKVIDVALSLGYTPILQDNCTYLFVK